MSVRTRVALALVVMIGLAALVAPSPAHAVANMRSATLQTGQQDGPQVCTATTTNHAYAEAAVWHNVYAGLQINGDSWIQLLHSTNCVWYVRTKVNIWSAAANSPRNFGYDGQVNLRQNGVDIATTPVYVGSVGPDGITSIYSEWEPRVCGKSYSAAGWGFAAAHNYTWYTVADWWIAGAAYDADC